MTPLLAPALLLGGLLGAANLGESRKNNKYLKSVQEKTWEREDTAVQRLRAQMEASGFSPVLAAGQQAQTSAPVRTEAPQVGTDMPNLMMTAATMQDQFQTSATQRALMGAQADAAKAAATNSGMEAAIKNYDLGIAQKYGVPYSAPSTVKTATSALEGAKTIGGKLGSILHTDNKFTRAILTPATVAANALKGIQQKAAEAKANAIQRQSIQSVQNANQAKIDALRRDAYLRAKAHKGGK